MERKFDSELGKEVASGRRSKSSLKLGVAGVAVASCALLVCLAGMSIAMGGSEDHGSPNVIESTVFEKEVDELAWLDCDAAVKRTMNLKYRAATDCSLGGPFTKFNYGMNFMFNDTVDLQDYEVSTLTLTFASDDVEELDLSDASASVWMVISGTDVLEDGTLVPISYESGLVSYAIVDNVVVIEVVIPDIEWSPSAGDSMHVGLTIEIIDHALHGVAVESPWSGLPATMFEDHVGTF